MDAPTTTSADNGTTGDDGGGWFKPRSKPVAGPQQSGPGAGPDADSGQDRIPGSARPSRPVSAIRPVGTGASRPQHPASPGAPRTSGPWALDELTARHRAAAAQGAPGGAEAAVPAEAPAPAEAHGDAPEAHGDVPEGRGDAPGAPTAQHGAAEVHPEPDDGPVPTEASPATARAPESPDAILVRRTLAEVGPVAGKVTSYFYALLFVRHPDLRALFPAAMDTQRDRLLKALLTAAEHIDNAPVLTEYLRNLGRGHRKYGTQPAHYPAVGEALLGSLARFATTTWDEESEAAWIRTYTAISQIMIDAAAENERHAPAWWQAEVVSHDLRTPDIAVITLRPDQPYPFLAGQYTSLETPWWPRIWRHYSFAAAPRPDGLLSFHVKAVPAGWVSNALVHRARPGDIVRLGPPAGSMTVDHTTDNGLLCLGGGTGIAPIKALVEDVAEHGTRRLVDVFYGARSDFDLYDIDTMLRMEQSHSWLQVRPVVDNRAQFPDAVREFGPWNSYDAYLSGPPGMIRSGIDALRNLGIPGDRIRHDSVEELVAAGD